MHTPQRAGSHSHALSPRVSASGGGGNGLSAGSSPRHVQAAAGPSTPHRASAAAAPRPDGGLWTDILRSADRQKALARKNVVLLSERHRGRAHLLDKIAGKRRAGSTRPDALAVGYDVLQSDDRDEDAAPPVSVVYPPSSHPSLLRLVDVSLPPDPLPNSAVVIVLDWSKPSTMVRELLAWLRWVDDWAARAKRGSSVDSDELHERLKSYLQHYAEPPAAGGAASAPLSSVGGTVLPLGPGTLSRNPSGVPIVVVCTRADLMDSVADEMGMKGGGWEERTDWIQQVLRTVCLAYGAALFYTAPTQPQTYTLLRDYLFHRLYAAPTSSEGTTTAPPQPARFPFPHRANVLDRDAVMVPAGWDSYGKITVLREPFDPARVAKAWDVSASRAAANGAGDDTADEEGIEDLWAAMIPDIERAAPPNPAAITTTSEPEQAFLQRHLDGLIKSDAKGVFRRAADSSHATATTDSALVDRYAAGGVVGPMATSSLSLPTVERAMAEMEAKEDKKPSPTKETRSPTSPTERPAVKQNEALHSFFQGLLARKEGGGSAANTPSKTSK